MTTTATSKTTSKNNGKNGKGKHDGKAAGTLPPIHAELKKLRPGNSMTDRQRPARDPN